MKEVEEFIARINASGGPAFSTKHTLPGGGEYQHPGMTLRDWIAGNVAVNQMQLNEHNCNDYQAQTTARWAYMVADAMLAERSK